jgi:hypothetical protein
MSQELTYFLYFIGYLLAVLIVDDQLFPFLNNLKKSLSNGVNRFHDESKNFYNNGENLYNSFKNKSENDTGSSHRSTFIFVSIVSLLLMTQNIVSLSKVLETVGTFGDEIFQNVGLLSNFTWALFIAFGIVLTEFVSGWALFYKQNAQKEDDPKNTMWNVIGTIFLSAAFVFCGIETMAWSQLSDAIASDPDFANPFEGGIFEGMSDQFFAFLGVIITLIEFALGYIGAYALSKFNGFRITETIVSISQHIRSFSFYVLSLAMYLISLIFNLIPFAILVIEQAILFISIPAHFIFKRIPWLK